MSQELVNSVNKLTDETSALLQEYVKGNTVLQNSASDAASSAAAAKASETNSVNQANIATQKAAESKQYRDEAAAIVTGGTATVDPAPGKIPLANSQGKISSGWLTALAFARTKADMDAMRASVNRQCAASGMIHAGTGHSGDNVNEGMWCYSATPNQLFLGKSGAGSGHLGSSETDYPVFNIAGFPVSLRGVNSTSRNQCQLRFLQAPDGTDIYDSSGNCRGTGKSTLNLLTEVDPKYGDVAPNVNEAVARAFEGLVKNGDFRLGDNADWSLTGSASAGVGGTVLPVSSSLWSTETYTDGVTYVVEVVANSVVGSPTFRHTTAKNDSIINEGVTRFTFTYSQASDINPRCQISTGSTASCNITSVSIRPATEEVVTERVDLSGLEGYLEEITPAKPYIYPYGGINNQATSVDGISTTVDNVRPITYFANFDGDTTSRGRGWNLNVLTDTQLLTILQNPYHHVYVIDGKLVQFRVRPRTIAGAGNGDWAGIPSNGEALRYHANRLISPHGAKDSGEAYTTSSPYYYGYASTQFKNVHSTIGQGVFGSANFNGGVGSLDTTSAYNGECYFYVLATVLRLNQGAYHPSFNPLGAQRFEDTRGFINTGHYWYSENAYQTTSALDCFTNTSRILSGNISSGVSGRLDGKFYDAIYPDGEGGVIDRRLSAFPVTMEDYFKAMVKAENGTMRGMEKLKRTWVSTTSHTTATNASYIWIPESEKQPKIGDIVLLKDSSVWNVYKIINSPTKVSGRWDVQLDRSRDRIENELAVISQETSLSVSGNFLQTDVIGDPANILQVDALKDGWLGSWIPQIPDGTVKNFSFTRKNLDSGDIPLVLTSTNGVTWNATPLSASFRNVVTNSISGWSPSASTVLLLNYTAAAKMTRPSSILSVFGDESGFSSIRATSNYWSTNGVFLVESLMGKVAKNDAGIRAARLAVSAFSVSGSGRLSVVASAYYPITHAAIPLSAPSNNSPAIKVLPHAASINGQATLGFAWNELKHDGTSWGDDGTMLVIDNTGTYNNLNGQSCLYGYAELALPIGWVANHARFGTQVPGVDL